MIEKLKELYAQGVGTFVAAGQVISLAEIIRQLEQAEKMREALAMTDGAIKEYYRYWTGGETRGSYDGKPERADLWKAGRIAHAALNQAKGDV